MRKDRQMGPKRPGRAAAASLAVLVVAVVAIAGSAAFLARRAAPDQSPATGSHRAAWTTSWAAMPQLTEPGNMPPAPFTGTGEVLVDSTLRQTVHVSLGGRVLRLRFSNAFGGAPLPLSKVTVARPAGGNAGTSAILPGTVRPVTFSG